METEVLKSEKFNEYIQTCKGDVKNHSAEGYYHFDKVAEAYEKGFNDGQNVGKKTFLKSFIDKEIEKFTQKANQIYILSKKVISLIEENNYKVEALYIGLSFDKPSVIISVKNETLNNDEFTKIAYTRIFKVKEIYDELFDEVLDIGLVGSDNLDEEILKDEGFDYIEQYTSNE